MIWFLALLLLSAGVGCIWYGVFLLAGLGWSLLLASVPCLALSVILMRGLLRSR